MSEQKTIRLSYARHHQQTVVRINFTYDTELAGMVKQLAVARWSQTMKCWYVPKEQFDLPLFFEAFRETAWVRTTEIYTHVSNESLKNIKNPFDELL